MQKINNSLDNYATDPLVKRWNNTFIYDKILSTWMRFSIRVLNIMLTPMWSTLLIIARYKHKYINKKYRSAICAIFKDESLNMKEWLEYHRLIGIEHIYLYDNNSTDSSCAILKHYIDEGYVTLIGWKMPPPSQAQAYQHFRDNFWNETEWVSFIDLDEFICLKYDLNISNWLKRFNGYPSVTMYWRMFGSSGIIDHDSSRLVTEQYTLAWDKYCDIGKPIFNTRFVADRASVKNIHVLHGKVSLFGKQFTIPTINEFGYFVNFHVNNIGLHSQNDFTIQVNHYATKSYIQYFINKKRRGDACGFSETSRTKWPYIYNQMFATEYDVTIQRLLPFLKVRMSGGSIPNYFDSDQSDKDR